MKKISNLIKHQNKVGDFFTFCGLLIISELYHVYLDLKQIIFFSSGFGGPVVQVKNIQIVVLLKLLTVTW